MLPGRPAAGQEMRCPAPPPSHLGKTVVHGLHKHSEQQPRVHGVVVGAQRIQHSGLHDQLSTAELGGQQTRRRNTVLGIITDRRAGLSLHVLPMCGVGAVASQYHDPHNLNQRQQQGRVQVAQRALYPVKGALQSRLGRQEAAPAERYRK